MAVRDLVEIFAEQDRIDDRRGWVQEETCSYCGQSFTEDEIVHVGEQLIDDEVVEEAVACVSCEHLVD